MMRRMTTSMFVAALMIGAAAGPTNAQPATSKTTGPLPVVKEAVISGACPFDVLWTDRGGRTLTTWARGRDIVRQQITGVSQVVLANASTGLTVPFDISETTTIVYNPRRGTATTVQFGDSGLIFDTGTATRRGSFTWYGGVAATSGSLDPATLLYTDVRWQRHAGLEGDVCEMLVSGLKTRH